MNDPQGVSNWSNYFSLSLIQSKFDLFSALKLCEIYVWSHAILIDGAKDFLKSQLNSSTISHDFFKALNVAHGKKDNDYV